MSKKILIIPHHPGLFKIKIRLIEIAKAMAPKHKVYVVNWRVPEKCSLMGRFWSSLKDVFNKIKLYQMGNLHIVEFPTLHRPLCLVSKFNYFWLTKIIEKEKIDIVINGSFYMFSFPRKRNFKYIFDVADLPAPSKETSFDKFIWNKTSEEIKKADAVTVISYGLAGYISRNYQREAFIAPNGADLGKLRSVRQQDVMALRQKYNLVGRWVIGYIGNIGSWVNVELVVEAFREVKNQIPEAALLWIGLSPHLEVLRKKYANESIIFTGALDDIEPYFKMLDLGLLPHRKCPLQDVAFHIKLIEYTAAEKFVISAPLEESQRLGFPNIIFVEENKNEWAKAIKKAKEMKWQQEWDNLVKDYDWAKIGDKFISFIKT